MGLGLSASGWLPPADSMGCGARDLESWASALECVGTGGQSRLSQHGVWMSAEGLLFKQFRDKAYSKQPPWTFGSGQRAAEAGWLGICTSPEANSVGAHLANHRFRWVPVVIPCLHASNPSQKQALHY